MKRWMPALTALALSLTLLPCAEAMQTAQTGAHAPYLYGFPDGTIRPESPVTREQLAQILLRLMEQPPDALQTESAFCDLPRSRWSYEAVSALAGLGVLPGGTDGRFEPEQTLTGGTLAVALRMIAHTQAGEAAFPTLAAGWKRESRQTEQALLCMETVSRAELAALLNRLLCRQTQTQAQMGSDCFADNAEQTAWYYADVREASVPHCWQEEDGAERWTAVG